MKQEKSSFASCATVNLHTKKTRLTCTNGSFAHANLHTPHGHAGGQQHWPASRPHSLEGFSPSDSAPSLALTQRLPHLPPTSCSPNAPNGNFGSGHSMVRETGAAMAGSFRYADMALHRSPFVRKRDTPELNRGAGVPKDPRAETRD